MAPGDGKILPQVFFILVSNLGDIDKNSLPNVLNGRLL
jgi:hypothetical protein